MKLPVDVKSVVMVLFLSAGALKSDAVIDALPIDYTLLMSIILLISVVVNLAQQSKSVPRAINKIFVLFLLFLIPVLWTSSTPYAAEKVVRLFTLNLLCTIGALVLFRTLTDLRRFLNAAFGVSVLIVIDGFVKMCMNPGLMRLSGDAATPIMLGVYAGIALLWSFLLTMETGYWRKILILPQFFFMIIMIAAGSRGPLVSFAVSLISILLICKFRIKIVFIGIAMVCSMVLLILYASTYIDLPVRSVTRITDFVYGDIAEKTRLSYWNMALPYILHTPQGIGWGGFGIINGETGRFFVHNLVIEIFLEAGWLAGLFFLWMLLTALRRVINIATHSQHTELLGIATLFIFMIMMAIISGEITDSRWIFAFLPLAFTAKKFIVRSLPTKISAVTLGIPQYCKSIG